MVNKITLLSIGVLAAIMIIMTSSAMAFEKKDNAPFRFEDYKREEEAQAALLKLHPVGSKAEDAVKTLEKAGAECIPVTNPSYTYNLYCLYKQKVLFVFTYEWHVSIRSDKKNNIESLKIQKGMQPL